MKNKPRFPLIIDKEVLEKCLKRPLAYNEVWTTLEIKPSKTPYMSIPFDLVKNLKEKRYLILPVRTERIIITVINRQNAELSFEEHNQRLWKEFQEALNHIPAAPDAR